MKYTVKKGDSMYSIAKHYDIPFAELVEANPGIQDPDIIYPGQIIEVPVAAESDDMSPGHGPEEGSDYHGGMMSGQFGMAGYQGPPGYPGGMVSGYPGGAAPGYPAGGMFGYPLGNMSGYPGGMGADLPGNNVPLYPGIGPGSHPGWGVPGTPGGFTPYVPGFPAGPETGIPGETGIMPGQIIRPGEKGNHVQALQKRLKEMGYFRGRVNGRYGRSTMSAVSRFQQDCSMPVNGLVDFYVWSSLGIR